MKKGILVLACVSALMIAPGCCFKLFRKKKEEPVKKAPAGAKKEQICKACGMPKSQCSCGLKGPHKHKKGCGCGAKKKKY